MLNTFEHRCGTERIWHAFAVLALTTASACSDVLQPPSAVPETYGEPSSPVIPPAGTSRQWFTWTESGGIVMMPKPAGAVEVRPSSINDGGEIVGTLVINRGSDASPVFHAFIWSPSHGFIDLGAAIGERVISDAWGIDDHGVIAGGYGAGDERYLFTWTDTAGIKLWQIPVALNAHISIANGVVALTPIDGYSISAPARFDVAAGTLHPLDVTKDRGGDANAINDEGTVAGYEGESRNGFGLSSDAVVWDRAGKKTTIFSCAEDSCFASVEAINDHGIAVGYITEGGPSRVFRWSREDGLKFIEVPEGMSDAVVRGIDDEGNIVGVLYRHGFLLKPSGALLEIELTPAGNPAWPVAMNSHGMVVGVVY